MRFPGLPARSWLLVKTSCGGWSCARDRGAGRAGGGAGPGRSPSAPWRRRGRLGGSAPTRDGGAGPRISGTDLQLHKSPALRVETLGDSSALAYNDLLSKTIIYIWWNLNPGLPTTANSAALLPLLASARAGAEAAAPCPHALPAFPAFMHCLHALLVLPAHAPCPYALPACPARAPCPHPAHALPGRWVPARRSPPAVPIRL